MKIQKIKSSFALILAALLLGACLGETGLPPLETTPVPNLPPPGVDPTLAAAPELRLSLAGQPRGTTQQMPQIPHDLVGRRDCLMCHKQGVSDAPRVPDDHRGLDSDICETCHIAPVSSELSGLEMYSRVCAHCHGANGEGSVGPALNVKSYLGNVTDDELRTAIIRGRGTGEMLAWGDLGLLTDRQVDEMIAQFRAWEPTAPESAAVPVPDTASAAFGDPEAGNVLYSQYCSGCHGFHGETSVGEGFILGQVTSELDDVSIARGIRDGGLEMPAFHALLTTNDISDLLALIRTWETGPLPTPTAIGLSGEEIFTRVCVRCHGQNGEGGVAPPLNSAEFLAENDDEIIRHWIERGTLGTSMMSWGDLGLLTTIQIDELVAFIRAWEPKAPSTAGTTTEPQIPRANAGDPGHGQQLFAQFCSGCHGLTGEHPTGPIILNSEAFLGGVSDEMLASQIQNGGREMPAFHAILTTQDMNDLLAFMRSGFPAEGPAAFPSFSADIQPIFVDNCEVCHGLAGGWSAMTYTEIVNSGDNAPVIIPGNPNDSLLIQKLLGTQTIGAPMPPSELLSLEEVELVIQWVEAGAPDN